MYNQDLWSSAAAKSLNVRKCENVTERQNQNQVDAHTAKIEAIQVDKARANRVIQKRDDFYFFSQYFRLTKS